MKICRTCAYYIPAVRGEKYEIGAYMGKCRKFGFVEPKTNELQYQSSVSARLNENQCGNKAKCYEKNRDAYSYLENE